MLLNILLNAIQAVERGSWVEARTRFDASRGEVCYEVADAGPGIPESIRGRIFDPFFTTKPPGVGTGLGLWVSYNIAKDHGGRIDVQTEAGRGTTFTIALPVGERRLEDQGRDREGLAAPLHRAAARRSSASTSC